MQHELQFGLNVAHKHAIGILWIKEVVAGRIGDLEVLEPLVEVLFTRVLLLQLLVLLFIVHDVFDLLVDLVRILDQVFLQGHALSNDVAFLCLLAPGDLFLDLFVVFNALDLRFDQISTIPHSIHEFCLQQVVKRV